AIAAHNNVTLNATELNQLEAFLKEIESSADIPVIVIDSDGDGVPDDQDDFPNDPAETTDTDGDGIRDKDDKCPTMFGPAVYNGCPDTDGDGIDDGRDRCPNTPGPVSTNGCPEISKKDKETLNIAMRAVQFDTGRSTLKSESFGVLKQIADIMRRYPDYNLMRIQFTPDLLPADIIGTMIYNPAFARPQLTLKEEEVKAEGIDIMLAIDLSSSMLAKDFEPDRLEVSKEVAIDFVKKRPHDRMGLAVFAGEAFTQCPLTTDQNILTDFLETLMVGTLADGTAIGMGLATAVNRLKDSESKSKIVILLTDGVNNTGYIDPETASQIAEEYDVKVYTIGVGSEGNALTPVNRRSNGDAYLQMPLTNDYAAAELFIKSANPNLAGTQGTAIDEAISLAMKAYEEDIQHQRALVIISDGEDHDESAISMAKEGADAGLVIYTVGVGTETGAYVPFSNRGRSEFKKDAEGVPVMSRLNIPNLQEIARSGGGEFYT
ncbi:unnamed protein product, partial [Cyprideis torosa]